MLFFQTEIPLNDRKIAPKPGNILWKSKHAFEHCFYLTDKRVSN